MSYKDGKSKLYTRLQWRESINFKKTGFDMDKETALLQDRIDKLELDNCEAQHKVDRLQKIIDELEKDGYDMMDRITQVKNLLKGY